MIGEDYVLVEELAIDKNFQSSYRSTKIKEDRW